MNSHLSLLENISVTKKHVKWLNDPAVNHFLEGVREIHHTLESEREYIRSLPKTAKMYGIYYYQNQIGILKLNVNERHRSADVSLFIGEKDFWGLHLGADAIRLAIEEAQRLKLHKLWAGVLEGNVRSLVSFLNAGFVVEGYFRESRYFEGQFIGAYYLGYIIS